MSRKNLRGRRGKQKNKCVRYCEFDVERKKHQFRTGENHRESDPSETQEDDDETGLLDLSIVFMTPKGHD